MYTTVWVKQLNTWASLTQNTEWKHKIAVHPQWRLILSKMSPYSKFEQIVLFIIISKTTQGNVINNTLYFEQMPLWRKSTWNFQKISWVLWSIPLIAIWPVKASYAFAVVKTASNKSLYILQVEITIQVNFDVTFLGMILSFLCFLALIIVGPRRKRKLVILILMCGIAVSRNIGSSR